MKTELYWLTMTLIATSLFWVPYIINRIMENGLIAALYNPNRDGRPHAEWANRMMHAHNNAVENIVLFAPLVIVIELLQLHSHATAMACMVFFFARLAHFFIYSFGIPYLRTICFFVGFVVQLFLALTILQSF